MEGFFDSLFGLPEEENRLIPTPPAPPAATPAAYNVVDLPTTAPSKAPAAPAYELVDLPSSPPKAPATSPIAPISYSPTDRDRLIRTVIGEVGGSGYDDERVAIAHVAANRAKRSGATITDEVLKPGQFEPWAARRAELESIDPGSPEYMSTAAIIDRVLAGQEPDPTAGGTHFYAPRTQAALGRNVPSWDNGKGTDIGRHRFFALDYGGQGQHGLGGYPAAENPPPMPGVNAPLPYEIVDLPKVETKPTFVESVKRGGDVLQQMGYGAVEATGEATGSDTLTQWGKEGREAEARELKNQPRTRLTDGDLLQWAKETVGEQLPIMAPSMGGALVGAGAGALVGGPIGATLGGVLGAFIPSTALGVGETQTAIKEKDPNAVAPGYAFAGGTAIGALDTALPGFMGTKLVKAFGREVAEEIAKETLEKPAANMAVRVAKGAAGGSAVEGATEYVQEVIGEVAASKGVGQPIDWQAAHEQGIEAGAAGALMGAGFGGASGVATDAKPQALPEGAEVVDLPQKAIGQNIRLPDQSAQPAAAQPYEVVDLPEEVAASASAAIKPAAPSAKGARTAEAAAPSLPQESATLKAAGYSDQDILDMHPEERAEALLEATERGISAKPAEIIQEPSVAPAEVPQPAALPPGAEIVDLPQQIKAPEESAIADQPALPEAPALPKAGDTVKLNLTDQLPRFGSGLQELSIAEDTGKFVVLKSLDGEKSARITKSLFTSLPRAEGAGLTPAPPVHFRDELESLLQTNPTAEQIWSHPALKGIEAYQDALPETYQHPMFNSPGYRANREFNFDGEKVKGYRNALVRYEEQARSFSGGKVAQGKHATIVIGAPAMGKSTLVENQIAQERKAAVIDPDLIKLPMPEYENGRGTGRVHRETSVLSAMLAKRFAQRGENIVWPISGRFADGIMEKIDRLHAMGYTVDLVHLSGDETMAAQRSLRRYLKEGRPITPGFARGAGKMAERTYIQLKEQGYADGFSEYESTPAGFRALPDRPTPPRALVEGLGGGRAGGPGNGLAEAATAVSARPQAGRAPGRVKPRPKPKGPEDVLSFVARMGGMQDETGELAAAGMPRWRGFMGVINKKGTPSDKMREAMVEAGYIRDHGAEAGETPTSTLDDARDLIYRAFTNKEKIYPAESAGYVSPHAQKGLDAAEAEEIERIADRVEEELRADFPKFEFKSHEKRRAAQLYSEGMDPIDILERLAQEFEEEISDESGGARGKGGSALRGGKKAGAQGDPADGPEIRGKAAKGARGVPQGGRKKPGLLGNVAKPPAGFDFGPEGKLQKVIPGAERASDGTIAQRKADAPLKPKKAQEGHESLGGLFGDAKKQKDFFASVAADPKWKKVSDNAWRLGDAYTIEKHPDGKFAAWIDGADIKKLGEANSLIAAKKLVTAHMAEGVGAITEGRKIAWTLTSESSPWGADNYQTTFGDDLLHIAVHKGTNYAKDYGNYVFGIYKGGAASLGMKGKADAPANWENLAKFDTLAEAKDAAAAYMAEHHKPVAATADIKPEATMEEILASIKKIVATDEEKAAEEKAKAEAKADDDMIADIEKALAAVGEPSAFADADFPDLLLDELGDVKLAPATDIAAAAAKAEKLASKIYAKAMGYTDDFEVHWGSAQTEKIMEKMLNGKIYGLEGAKDAVPVGWQQEHKDALAQGIWQTYQRIAGANTSAKPDKDLIEEFASQAVNHYPFILSDALEVDIQSVFKNVVHAGPGAADVALITKALTDIAYGDGPAKAAAEAIVKAYGQMQATLKGKPKRFPAKYAHVMKWAQEYAYSTSAAHQLTAEEKNDLASFAIKYVDAGKSTIDWNDIYNKFQSFSEPLYNKVSVDAIINAVKKQLETNEAAADGSTFPWGPAPEDYWDSGAATFSHTSLAKMGKDDVLVFKYSNSETEQFEGGYYPGGKKGGAFSWAGTDKKLGTDLDAAKKAVEEHYLKQTGKTAPEVGAVAASVSEALQALEDSSSIPKSDLKKMVGDALAAGSDPVAWILDEGWSLDADDKELVGAYVAAVKGEPAPKPVTYSDPKDHPQYQEIYNEFYEEIYNNKVSDLQDEYYPQLQWDKAETQDPDSDYLWENAKERLTEEGALESTLEDLGHNISVEAPATNNYKPQTWKWTWKEDGEDYFGEATEAGTEVDDKTKNDLWEKALEKRYEYEQEYYYEDSDSPKTVPIYSSHSDIDTEHADYSYGEFYWNGDHYSNEEDLKQAVWEQWLDKIAADASDEASQEAHAQAVEKIAELEPQAPEWPNFEVEGAAIYESLTAAQKSKVNEIIDYYAAKPTAGQSPDSITAALKNNDLYPGYPGLLSYVQDKMIAKKKGALNAPEIVNAVLADYQSEYGSTISQTGKEKMLLALEKITSGALTKTASAIADFLGWTGLQNGAYVKDILAGKLISAIANTGGLAAPKPKQTLIDLWQKLVEDYSLSQAESMDLSPILTKAQEKYNNTSSSQYEGKGTWGEMLVKALEGALPQMDSTGIANVFGITKAWLEDNKPPKPVAPPKPPYQPTDSEARNDALAKDDAERQATAIAKGLNMDWEAREKRRIEQGYTLKAYKGASSKEVYRTLQGREGSNYGSEGRGAFFSNKPDIANAFAGGGVVYPVWIRPKGFKTIDYNGQGYSSHGGNDAQITKAKKEGYTGLILKNVSDSGGTGDQIIVWNTPDVRGWFARFDPEDPAPGDILASIGLDNMPNVKLPPAQLKALAVEVKRAIDSIQRIAGADTNIRWHREILLEDIATPVQAAEVREAHGFDAVKLQGYYMPAEDLIGLALLGGPTSSGIQTNAAHEAFHRVMLSVATEREMRVLEAGSEQLIQWAARELKVSIEEAARLAYTEREAIAFQRYDRMRRQGLMPGELHIGIRRLFERIREILRAVAIVLRDKGYSKTSQIFADLGEGTNANPLKVFERVYQGELGKRMGGHVVRRERSLLASVAPTSQPGAAQAAAASRTAQTAGAIARRTGTKLDWLRTQLQDRMLPFARIEEEFGIPANLSTYLASRLYPGRTGEKLADLKQDHVEPVIEGLRAAGIKSHEFSNYLQARHARERNALIKRRDPANDAGSGWTDAEADAELARVRASGKQDAYDALAGKVDKLIEETRKTLLKAGLIDRETFDQWQTAYSHYVPLRGWEVGTEDEDLHFGNTGRGLQVRGKESKAALGRHSRGDNSFAFAVLQAQTAIVRAEKAKVAKTLYRAVEAHPNPDLWKVYTGEAKRRLNPKTGFVETYWAQPAFTHKDNIFGVKIGGKQKWIELKNRKLAQAMGGVGASIQNPILRGMMSTARIYAALQTQWNPNFVFTNLIKDLETALINLGDVDGLPPATRRKVVADAVSLKSVRGILSALRGKGNAEYAKWFDEYRRAGGKVSFIESNDIEAIKKRIDGAIKAGRIRRGLASLGKLVEDLNTSAENSARLSTFIAMRKAGIPADRAAFVARNLTVDFNLHGEYGPAINAMYIFFNASLQGTSRMLQAVGKSRKVQAAVATIFATGFALDILNSMMSGDDDDDGKSDYDEIPEWIKERNIIVMLGGGKGNYIKFPLAWGYNVPFLAGQQLMATFRGARKPMDAAQTIAWGALESFNPLGSVTSIWQYVAPTALDPGVQMLENKNWNGLPIFPTKFDRNKPDSETYFNSAPDWAVGVAKTLNSFTGGNIGKKGSVFGIDTDISPESIEHMATFVGGGTARFVLDAYKTGQRKIKGEEWLPQNTPIGKSFYGKRTNESDRQEFYEAWDKIDAGYYEVKTLAKAGDSEEAKAARARNLPEVTVWKMFDKTKDALKDLREARDRLLENSAMAAEEREKKIADLDARSREMIRRVLQIYAKAQREAGE